MFVIRYVAALCAVTLCNAGAFGGVTVEKGQPAVLICIDVQLREKISAESGSGNDAHLKMKFI